MRDPDKSLPRITIIYIVPHDSLTHSLFVQTHLKKVALSLNVLTRSMLSLELFDDMYCLDAACPNVGSLTIGLLLPLHVHQIATIPKCYLGAVWPYIHQSPDSDSVLCQVLNRLPDTHRHISALLAHFLWGRACVWPIFSHCGKIVATSPVLDILSISTAKLGLYLVIQSVIVSMFQTKIPAFHR